MWTTQNNERKEKISRQLVRLIRYEFTEDCFDDEGFMPLKKVLEARKLRMLSVLEIDVLDIVRSQDKVRLILVGNKK